VRKGEWTRDAAGQRHWRVRIEADGATGIRLHFTDFAVESGKVWIHDGSGKDQVFGPYSGKGRFGDGDFWTEMIFGSFLDLEYSPSETSVDEIPFEVREIFHSWIGAADQPNANFDSIPTGCFLDETCYENTSYVRSQASATVFLIFPEYVCSGTMINDRNSTNTPYLLTAGHCVTASSDARAMLAVFRFSTSSCVGNFGNPPALDPKRFPQVSGATLLARSLDSPAPGKVRLDLPDFAFVLLSQTPPVPYVSAGWSFSYNIGESLYSLSHPQGLPKSFAKGTVTGTVSPDFFQANMFQGRVDHGSSGSGIFNDGVQLKGVLSGSADTGNASACVMP